MQSKDEIHTGVPSAERTRRIGCDLSLENMVAKNSSTHHPRLRHVRMHVRANNPVDLSFRSLCVALGAKIIMKSDRSMYAGIEQIAFFPSRVSIFI